MAELRQFHTVPFTSQDRVENSQATQTRDVTQHVMDLDIH
jgi:hypothetical protein